MNSEWDKNRDAANRGIDLVSRVLAVCLLMALPGVGGSYLDSRFQTSWMMPVGIFIGMAFGIVGLLAILKVLELKDKAEDKHPYRRIDDSNEENKKDKPE